MWPQMQQALEATTETLMPLMPMTNGTKIIRLNATYAKGVGTLSTALPATEMEMLMTIITVMCMVCYMICLTDTKNTVRNSRRPWLTPMAGTPLTTTFMISANTIPRPMALTFVDTRSTNKSSAARGPKTPPSEAKMTTTLTIISGRLVDHYLGIRTKYRRKTLSAFFIGPTAMIDID